jgi:hypothetical protein
VALTVAAEVAGASDGADHSVVLHVYEPCYVALTLMSERHPLTSLTSV